jgi:hypothetical protein
VCAAWRCAHALAFLLLGCAFGCAPTHPGESFFAGYISPEKQSTVRRVFVVRNTTSDPVEILTVDRNCSCTSFELGKYRLAAGETTNLTMSVDLTKGFMRRTAACVLRTNHPTFKDWSYSLACVTAPFAVADPDVLNLGSFKSNGQNTDTVKREVAFDFYAASKVELSRDNFTVSEEIDFKLSPKPESRKLQADMWKTTYKASIGLGENGRQKVLSKREPGIHTETIELSVQNPEPRRWQYSMYWQVMPSLQSHPSHLSFGNVLDAAEDHRRHVMISSSTEDRFRILSVKSDSPAIRIEPAFNATDEAARHTVNFRAIGESAIELPQKGTPVRFCSGIIQVQTTDKFQPVVTIPWSATLERSGSQSSKAAKTIQNSGPVLD